jgi:hypothetical protein
MFDDFGDFLNCVYNVFHFEKNTCCIVGTLEVLGILGNRMDSSLH